MALLAGSIEEEARGASPPVSLAPQQLFGRSVGVTDAVDQFNNTTRRLYLEQQSDETTMDNVDDTQVTSTGEDSFAVSPSPKLNEDNTARMTTAGSTERDGGGTTTARNGRDDDAGSTPLTPSMTTLPDGVPKSILIVRGSDSSPELGAGGVGVAAQEGGGTTLRFWASVLMLTTVGVAAHFSQEMVRRQHSSGAVVMAALLGVHFYFYLFQADPPTPAPTETLLTLPPEIQAIIISRLDVRSRCRSAAVCGRLRSIVNIPIVWRDITRVSYHFESTPIYVTMKVNEYPCASSAKVTQAFTALLTHSRPKELVIRTLTRLNPLLPAGIEKLQLNVRRFDKHCFTLLQALAPSLKTANLTAYELVDDDPTDLGLGAHFHRLEVIRADVYREAADVLRGFEHLPKLRAIQLRPIRPPPFPVNDERARDLMMRWNEAVSPPSTICFANTLSLTHLRLLNGRARNAVRSVCADLSDDDGISYSGDTLVQIFPYIRRLSMVLVTNNDFELQEVEHVVSGLREALFTLQHTAVEQTTFTVDVRAEHGCSHMEDSRQTRGLVTVDIRYWDVIFWDDCQCQFD